MFIVIKDGTDFIRFDLEEVSLPYIYSGVEITKESEGYFFHLKKGFSFSDGGNSRKIELRKYVIRRKELFNDLEIYVYESGKGFDDYALYNNVPFILADNKKAPVICCDPYLENTHLYLKNGQISTNSSCLLLNGRIYENEILKDGDKLSLLNFVFFYYEDFLYMNSFMVENRLQKKTVPETVVRYENSRPVTSTRFLPVKKELEIEKIREYHPLKPVRQRKMIFQIGPSITMSMAMLSIAGINVYNNYQNDQPLLNSLVYILMPVTMLLSGVLWPVLSGRSEKKTITREIRKKKEEYLNYLQAYEQRLIRNIDEHLKQEREYFFEGEICEDRLFYITDKSDMFLNVSVGFITGKKETEFRDTDDEDVNEGLNRIRYRLNNMENFPYYLDLIKHRSVSICSDLSKKAYLMKRFLLELSAKYHYDDFYLAIYSEDLSIFREFFGLPQLIFGNTRLTFNKKRELQELNSLKLEKPLVLLACDHVDFVFSNQEIRTVCFTDDRNRIYKDSEVFIEYLDNEGCIYGERRIPFTYEENDIAFSEYTRTLSLYGNIALINKAIGFKDIFADLDIASFYKEKQSGLRADFATIGDELLSFDLHESKEGPHGLIGGSTGSGKSELIVSLLLSLCIRYRPDYLNIILIDYKGGGIKESLSYMGESLPHIVASIDNLEADIFERLIVAIDFECRKRQQLFKELSDKEMTSIMNIDDYLDNDHRKYGLPDIAHLLIVVDEFAELKKENPEIIRELISFSRIGRSLGVHLILATQRPSGVIDDEIWSNSHFKIALKVLSDKDSNDIIKSRDAAYLNGPGEFYLSVDDSLLKAKAVYSKRDINNGEAHEVSLLDNRLRPLKKKSVKKNKPFTEAAYIVNSILGISTQLNVSAAKLDFHKAPAKSRKELLDRYGESSGMVLGEADDYLNARRYLLKVPANENIFIYSTRKRELETLLNQIGRRCIVIASARYGGGMICDSLLYDEGEDISFLFSKLLKEDADLVLVIEDLNCLLSYNEGYASSLYQLLRRKASGKLNIIAISRQSAITFKLLNCFKHKYIIEAYDNQDVMNIFTGHCEYKGNSFFFDEKIISFVPYLEEDIRKTKRKHPPYIERIPEHIPFEKKNGSALLGYGIQSRKAVYLKKEEKLLAVSTDPDTVTALQEVFRDCSNIKVMLYDRKAAREEYDRYLWIGDSLYNQRLFYVEGKDELQEGEAYYAHGNKGEVIRIIDHE